MGGEAVLDLARLLARLGDAVVVSDAGMRVRYANDAVRRLLGWEPAALAGGSLLEIIPPRLRAAHQAGFERYLATRVPHLLGGPPVRVPALRADGGEVDVELTLTAVDEEDADLVLVGVLRDPAMRVELERQTVLASHLRAAMDVAEVLQRTGTLADAVPEVLPTLCERLDWSVASLWLPDPDGAALHCADVWQPAGSVEPAFVSATRRARFRLGEGLPGRCWQEAAPVGVPALAAATELPRHGELLAAGLHSAVAFPLLGGRRVRGVIELFSLPPRPAEDDLLEVLALVGRQLGQFIDRAEAEQHSAQTAARYRSLVEASALDVWTTTPQGALVEDMPRWRSITGQTREQLLGTGWQDAIAAEDRGRVRALVADAVAAGQPYELEFRLRAREGGERFLLARAAPVVEGGRIVEWVGVTEDVSEHRRAQAAQLELAEVLQRMLAPGRLPSVPGLELAAVYRVGGEGVVIGGDFYDVSAVEPGVWDAVLGDVCGRGPQAAAVTALARTTVHAVAGTSDSPAEVLRLLNAALVREELDRPFITAAHVRLRLLGDTVSATVASGGHPLPLLLEASGKVRRVGQEGTLLGVLEQVDISDVTVHLVAGDTLVLYTDGLTEAHGPGRELYGEARLEDLLAGCAGCSAAEIAERVEASVLDFAGEVGDDLAVLVLKVG